jgi:putative transposase
MTGEGMVYVSFLQDGFSLRILGYTVATSKSVELVTKALNQAISVRRRGNRFFTGEGVIHHSDAGSQIHQSGVQPEAPRERHQRLDRQGRHRL